jgi:hypothetical protein
VVLSDINLQADGPQLRYAMLISLLLASFACSIKFQLDQKLSRFWRVAVIQIPRWSFRTCFASPESNLALSDINLQADRP